MLNIRDLKIDPASLGNTMLLVDVLPMYQYKDGVRMDTVIGYRYMVALPSHALEKIGVKIDGPQLMDKPDDFVPVTFSGLEVQIYESGGKVAVTAKATGVHATETEED